MKTSAKANEKGNVPRPDVVPWFSDLKVVALGLAAEALGIDSESLLFSRLEEYRREMPRLLSRRRYNDRRKSTALLCQRIHERMARWRRGLFLHRFHASSGMPDGTCQMLHDGQEGQGAPSYGYCATQGPLFYGYKLHAVCGLNGVIPSFDLTRASVHDLHYLKDVEAGYAHCTLLGDKGHISAQAQLDLFESARIRLEAPCRKNQRDRKPAFQPFAKARKRTETVSSQLCDPLWLCAITRKTPRGCSPGLSGKSQACIKKRCARREIPPTGTPKKARKYFFFKQSFIARRKHPSPARFPGPLPQP